jgi:periplasmic protein CpxP/Spy
MKKIASLLFAVAIVSANLLAQDPPKEKQAPKTPEERAERMTRRLTKELALNADQQAKTKAVLLKKEQNREEEMKKQKAEHEKLKAEFKSFLTDEQYKKFEEKQKEMRSKRQHHRGQKAPPVPAKPIAPEK